MRKRVGSWLSGFTGGEIAGVAIIVVAALALVVAVALYASGDQSARLGLLGAFALGTTGFGTLAAGREARRRRDERAAAAAGVGASER
ncbi:hypothetical protein SAMN05428970_3789 [Agromyces sp. CF514]|uniref:hypothetical protein n=1 Tax=Agromyces sp. CF514 TaxID=1881031 RepID=UPI0008E14526|nr:hypothetical protein [Agromyces sp. CF514]SFR91366.1 hypothetical protein SAMN05428970_3789 [Agromyces sp. CF514]